MFTTYQLLVIGLIILAIFTVYGSSGTSVKEGFNKGGCDGPREYKQIATNTQCNWNHKRGHSYTHDPMSWPSGTLAEVQAVCDNTPNCEYVDFAYGAKHGKTYGDLWAKNDCPPELYISNYARNIYQALPRNCAPPPPPPPPPPPTCSSFFGSNSCPSQMIPKDINTICPPPPSPFTIPPVVGDRVIYLGEKIPSKLNSKRINPPSAYLQPGDAGRVVSVDSLAVVGKQYLDGACDKKNCVQVNFPSKPGGFNLQMWINYGNLGLDPRPTFSEATPPKKGETVWLLSPPSSSSVLWAHANVMANLYHIYQNGTPGINESSPADSARGTLGPRIATFVTFPAGDPKLVYAQRPANTWWRGWILYDNLGRPPLSLADTGCNEQTCCIPKPTCASILGDGGAVRGDAHFDVTKKTYGKCPLGKWTKDPTKVCSGSICTTDECCVPFPTCAHYFDDGEDYSSQCKIAGLISKEGDPLCNEMDDSISDGGKKYARFTPNCSNDICCQPAGTCAALNPGCQPGLSIPVSDYNTKTCDTNPCLQSDCCVPNPKCSSDFQCGIGWTYDTSKTGSTCKNETCEISDCCTLNQNCVDFVAKNTCGNSESPKNPLSAEPCKTSTCQEHECCNNDPTCTEAQFQCESTFYKNKKLRPDASSFHCAGQTCTEKDCCIITPTYAEPKVQTFPLESNYT